MLLEVLAVVGFAVYALYVLPTFATKLAKKMF